MFLRALLLLVLCLLACWPQWGLPDWTGTEGRRLQIADEMLHDGDWLVPTLGGQPTWAKPPLHYWVLAGCMRWAPRDPWLLRLPSVLSLWLAAVVAMELHRRWFSAAAGWVVGLGMLLSPVALVMWPTIEIDPLFASLTAMSLFLLATGVARERAILVLASGILGGLAFLQKGPPYFLFAGGAYLVWWRRRGLRSAWLHFVPLLLLPVAYYLPLWLLRVAPTEMLAVAGEETVGRLWTFQLQHLLATPGYWLRAVAIQLPLVLWCFWEWRGARDARMDAADLTLRMCSGAAVLAVVLLTVFPGRPTRYLMPNLLLFPFAVAPAVAHFAAQPRQLGLFSRRVLFGLGLCAALVLLALPFWSHAVGSLAVVLAAAIAATPFWVRRPVHLVAFCLGLPLLAAWTVVHERAQAFPASSRSRKLAGELLARELAVGGTGADLQTHGHIEGPLLLWAGLRVPGNETANRAPTARFVLHEHADQPPPLLDEYVERLRLCMPREIFALRERRPKVGR